MTHHSPPNPTPTGDKPHLELGLAMYVILGAGTLSKLGLYFYCVAVKGKSDSINALAEDHLNDVMSNVAAMATAILAFEWKKGWWVDATGAILIAVYIIWRWTQLTIEQVGGGRGFGIVGGAQGVLSSWAGGGGRIFGVRGGGMGCKC